MKPSTFANRLTMSVAAIAAACTALAQDSDRAAQDKSFGAYVLDTIELAESAAAVARTIAERSIDSRRDWSGEDALTEEEKEWYGHDNTGESGDKPGGGPPAWAPAHGYRRKFGDQQQQDLGRYVHQCVQEGVRDENLILAIRVVIDRVSNGGEVGDRRAEQENAEENSKNDPAPPGKSEDKGQHSKGKQKNGGQPK